MPLSALWTRREAARKQEALDWLTLHHSSQRSRSHGQGPKIIEPKVTNKRSRRYVLRVKEDNEQQNSRKGRRGGGGGG